MAERWDTEWIEYFRRAPNYFENHARPTEDAEDRASLVRIGTQDESAWNVDQIATDMNPVWAIWKVAALPSEIWQQSVVDLGCGAGGIGRTLGYCSQDYLGLDYSPLAVHVANLVSPPSCTYAVRFELEKIAGRLSRYDVAFSRKVFIHQNFDESVSLAGLAASLLRPGGLLIADFYHPSKDMSNAASRGRSRLAKDELDDELPSIGFYYTDEELEELASRVGLVVEHSILVPRDEWKIVRFRKPA
jgi:SAM-dependent methyltransferase